MILSVLAMLSVGPVFAAVDGVSASLVGGEVKGAVKGEGKASVRASVSNLSGRELRSVVLGVYYSAVDAPPAPDALWRQHAFEFDPPLSPGKSVTVRFSDDDAFEYIALDVQGARFGPGLSFNGEIAPLEQPLSLRDGVYYIATRDLMDVIGGGISYDAKTYMVGLERGGIKIEVKPDLGYALVNGEQHPLEHPVLELDGRSLLPLAEVAALFGLSVSVDEGQELVLLEN